MAKDFAVSFYNGAGWDACRRSFIAERVRKDGGMCQSCRRAKGQIVHHKVELTAENIHDPEIALNHELLEYLCLECHNKEPGHFGAFRRGGAVRTECVFDESGDVVGVMERG